MRDDVNYRQRAEETKRVLMDSLTVSDFIKHKSEYNWVNTQKQFLLKGELPKDRKQFLDKFLPKWNENIDVLLENMHSLKIKELYNQGYTDLKTFSDVNSIKDAYMLAYVGITDIKTLMNIPSNLLIVKETNNPFLNSLQKKLREGLFKPTKRALNLAQAISKTQFAILHQYEPNLKSSDIALFWLHDSVPYTYSLIEKPYRLWMFNFCSPSYYNEKESKIEMLFTPSQVKDLVREHYRFRDDYNANTKNILINLCKTWNNSTLLTSLLNENSRNDAYNPDYTKFIKDWKWSIDKYFNTGERKSSNFDGYINESTSSSSYHNSGHSGHSAMEIMGFMAAVDMLSDDGDDGGDDD